VAFVNSKALSVFLQPADSTKRMKISYSWLRDYIQTDCTVEEAAEILTNTGLEVEGIETVEQIKGNLAGVVVGEVLTCVPHPNADRLRLTTVNIGEPTPLQIVCGAPNVAVGQKVLVATIGTTLYFKDGTELKIKKGKIRGEVSEGMICAEDELGLGTDHDGIMVLDAHAEVGIPAATFLDLQQDAVLEIGLTPNRADAMSHFGVARDLHAALRHQGRPCTLALPDVSAFATNSQPAPISVSIMDSEACPHYTGITIVGIAVKPSPEWLQTRLKALGIAPKNNVVDVTNYVLHETGHPLHAFDLQKIVGNQIIVKTLDAETSFTTLDEKVRSLNAADLMICDAEKGLCMAGVFGGLGSGISATSTGVFLESAYFSPTGIRKTAKRHGLNTDASFRYERGVDPRMTEYALKRAALLILDLAGGTIVGEIQQAGQRDFPNALFQVSPERMRKLIGAAIPDAVMMHILKHLDIQVTELPGFIWQVAVPPYRVDVTREADIAEEIIRIFGLNQVPVPEQMQFTWRPNPRHKPERFRTRLTALLNGAGFSEVMNISLSKKAYYEALGTDQIGVEMRNPLSQELNMMRQTLSLGFLENVAYNKNRKRGDLRLFEWGKVYTQQSEGFSEIPVLGLAVSGATLPENWEVDSRPYSFFFLKGVVLDLLKNLGMTNLTEEVIDLGPLYSDVLAILSGKSELARICRIHDGWTQKMDVATEVFTAEIFSETLFRLATRQAPVFEPLPKFPSVRRDLALLVDTSVTYRDLEQVAQKAGTKLLREINLFDVYQGKNLPEGKKSYAMSFVFRSDEKTMQDKQVEQLMGRVLDMMEKETGASLRVG
jgi:phenylalanyl-tRNA synthetase beta chain